MGTKGDKLTQDSVQMADLLMNKLAFIGEITAKKMFGGHGVFHDGKMFAMVDSKGQAFLKANDKNKSEFEKNGSVKHGRMPYYSIPDSILYDSNTLLEWA